MLKPGRLLWSRGTSAPGVLLAAGAAATIAAALLVAFTGLAPAVAESALRQILDDAPLTESRMVVTSGLPAQKWGATDAAVRQLAAEHADQTATKVRAAAWVTSFETASLGDDFRLQAGFVDDVADRARLVSGRWPQPQATPVEVAVHSEALGHLGATGNLIPLKGVSDESVTPVKIVGVWAPNDPTDPIWNGLGDGFRPPDDEVLGVVGPLIAERSDVLNRLPLRAGSSVWTIESDLTHVTRGSVADARDSASDLAHDLSRVLSSARDGTELTPRGGPQDLLLRAEAAAKSAGSLLGTVSLQLAALAAVALWFTVRLLAEQRAPATALLRARGASTSRISAWSALAALLPALVVAIGGTALARLLAESWTTRAAAEVATAGSALVGVVVAAAWLVLLSIAEVRAAPSVAAVRRQISRPVRGMIRRGGADLLVLVLGVVALQQLYRPDPPVAVLIVAPTLIVFAGAVAILRGLPLLAHIASGWGRRSKQLGGALATWEVSRRPAGHLASGLLVVLAISMAMLSATTLATWQTQRIDTIDFSEPADLRVTWADDSDRNQGNAKAIGADLAAVPGVSAVMPVWRWRADLPSGGADVLGVTPARAQDVMRWRPDLMGENSASELFATLVETPARSEVPAILTAPLARKLGAQPGDVVRLRIHALEVPVLVTAIAQAVPGTVTPAAALVHGDQMTTRLFVETRKRVAPPRADTTDSSPAKPNPRDRPNPPDEWWLATTSDTGAISKDIADRLGLTVSGHRIELVNKAEQDGAAAGIDAGLTAGFWGSAMLVVIGVGAHTVARARRRRAESALLRALGTTSRESAKRLLVEQSFTVGVAGVAGIVLGIGVASLVGPAVIRGLAGLAQLPPLRLAIPWPLVAGAVVGVAALTVGVAAYQAVGARLVPMAATLREDEQA